MSKRSPIIGRRALAGLMLLLAACAPPGELAPRQAPTGLAMPQPAAEFAGYVEAARAP